MAAVVLDVGINRDENNKLCGDVDFEDVKDKVMAITPVREDWTDDNNNVNAKYTGSFL